MKILINTATTFKGGGVQVANSFISECTKFDEHEYHVILGESLSEILDKSRFPDNFSFYNIDYRPATRVFRFQSEDQFFKKLENKINPQVVFTTSGPAYWRPEAPHLAGYNLPHYIYRDSPYFDKLSITERLKWDLKGLVINYYFKRDADAYVVQTDDVNQRLRKLLSREEIYTVSNTISDYYLNPEQVPDKLPERKKNEFRLLILSAWYKHKNLEIIPAVIKELPDLVKNRVRFVLTLPDEEFERYITKRDNEHLINIGPVIPEEGPSLYQECDALFLPTLLECFSASYAEAMAMKKPIITSDLGFAHEICGDAAIFTDPLDPGKIASAIMNLILNPALQLKLVNEGKKQLSYYKSAEKRAEEYLKLCQLLINGIKKN